MAQLMVLMNILDALDWVHFLLHFITWVDIFIPNQTPPSSPPSPKKRKQCFFYMDT
jgi:hypothetical protein